MDTQGLFDNKLSIKINQIIFNLSTLLSSVQIYNIKEKIDENKLHYINLFCEIGRSVVKSSSSLKPFQHIYFLVRDWANCYEFKYGFDGGKKYVNEKILKKNLVCLEKNSLADIYQNIDCFLMPHPGIKVHTSHNFKLLGKYANSYLNLNRSSIEIFNLI